MAERERWVLWLPPLIGAGIAIYFALPSEPVRWAGPITLVAIFFAALGYRGRTRALLVLLAVGAVAAGYAVAQIRTESLKTATLERHLGPVELTGFVIQSEIHKRGRRLVLGNVVPGERGKGRVPDRVRISVRGAEGVLPGDRISLRAVLNPPPAPSAPGAFDFRRYAFFQGIGAVGYGLGNVEILQGGRAGGVNVRLARWRSAITKRILDAAPGSSGAVAAALMTGERGAVPEKVLAYVRDSGLAHLLAISGLHMALVAGTIFFAVRALLASAEAVALRYPIKKWAAIAAFAGALAYLLISGATVPTRRAFLMTSLVLLAILADRKAISMRLVAWAALVILLLTPESLLSASFQMSFAAVIALVSAYETLAPRMARWRRGGGLLRRAGLYLAAVGLTTLIAGAATAPFAAYHFNRFVDYGLVANVLAVPLMAFWVMPWGVFTFLLLPFGLESLALVPMTLGIDAVLWIAETVSSWPGAVRLIPAMPVAGLVLLAIGGLWLCLWRRGWRHLGWVAMTLGLATIAMVQPPDLLIDGGARLVAVRSPDGGLMVSDRRAAKFVSSSWLRRDGEAAPAPWPKDDPSPQGPLHCDTLGCIYRFGQHIVALPLSEAALGEDCLVADVVVSRVPVRSPCPSARVVVDRFDLWREGAHAIWLTPTGVRVESVRDRHGSRPWTNAADALKTKRNQPDRH